MKVFCKFDDKSKDLIDKTSKAGIKAYNKAGTKAVKIIRNGISVRTGLLKDSIGKKTIVLDGIPVLDVGARNKVRGTKAYHAHLVEKGTGNRVKKNGMRTGSMPAKPFLSNRREEIERIFQTSVKEELKKLSEK